MSSAEIVAGAGIALSRLLRPELHEVLRSVDALDLTVEDLLALPRAADVPTERAA